MERSEQPPRGARTVALAVIGRSDSRPSSSRVLTPRIHVAVAVAAGRSILSHVAEDLPPAVLFDHGPEQPEVLLRPGPIADVKRRLTVDAIRAVIGHAREPHGRQLVRAAAMPREGVGEPPLALLAKLTPHVRDRQVALRPRRRQLRPDVLAELLLRDREGPETVAIPTLQRVQNGLGNGLSGRRRLISRRNRGAGGQQNARNARSSAQSPASASTDRATSHARPSAVAPKGSAGRTSGPHPQRWGYDVHPCVQSAAGSGPTAPMKVTVSKNPSLGG